MRTVWSSRKRVLFFGLPLSFTKYTLTDEKFVIHSGFFTTTEDEIRLYRIVDISLKRGLGQKIFGLGTITLYTKDRSAEIVTLKNVKDSASVKELISECVEKERVRKRVVSRDNMGFDHYDDYDDHDPDDYDDYDDR